MDLELSLKQGLQRAFKELFDADVDAGDLALQPTRKEFEGTYTFVTFPYGRLTKQRPDETARRLGEHLRAHMEAVAGYNVVKGFLNLEVAAGHWREVFRTLRAQPDFSLPEPTGQRVMVEYASPNTNKPLHLGHLRNIFLGASVAELMRADGHEVVRANLINDRGVHICKSMVAYRHFGEGENPASSGLKGDHLVGKYYVRFDQAYRAQVGERVAGGIPQEQAEKEAPLMQEAQAMLQRWEEGDAEVRALWEQMNGWVYDGFRATYERMGIAFDQYYYESNTYLLGKEVIDEGLEKGVFYRRDDGSVWVDLSDEGLDEKLLLRSDGTSVYMTQDLGTAELKYRDHRIDRSVYVVGNEQDYHFQVLFEILKKLGRPYAGGLYHLSYGMVDLPSGKMKSREGTVVDADDLQDEMVRTAAAYIAEQGKTEGLSEAEKEALYRTIALGALKYFLLKVGPKRRMLFNPAESVDLHGHTGPFVQYTHARTASVGRYAAERNLQPQVADDYTPEPREQELIFLLATFAAKVHEAAGAYDPSVLAQYVYDVAKAYNRFYDAHSILKAESPAAAAFRLSLNEQVGKTIRRGLGLLGIEAPERM
ncbi:MAG: arginine--tRNA ligase [Catalinimonas sp.]